VPATEDANEHVTVEVPPEARVTLAGHDVVRLGGDVRVRAMVPAKPARLENVRPSVKGEPALNPTEVGPAMLKSVMFTAKLTEWLREPLVPFIVSV